jgi:hypothetical protein
VIPKNASYSHLNLERSLVLWIFYKNTKIFFQTFELIAIVVKPKISTLPKRLIPRHWKKLASQPSHDFPQHDNPHYIGLAISDNLKHNTPKVHWQLELCILFTYIPFPNPNVFLQSDPRCNRTYWLVNRPKCEWVTKMAHTLIFHPHCVFEFCSIKYITCCSYM